MRRVVRLCTASGARAQGCCDRAWGFIQQCWRGVSFAAGCACGAMRFIAEGIGRALAAAGSFVLSGCQSLLARIRTGRGRNNGGGRVEDAEDEPLIFDPARFDEDQFPEKPPSGARYSGAR